MKTKLEQLRIELQSEKMKIANIESRMKDLENLPESTRYPKKFVHDFNDKAIQILTKEGCSINFILDKKYTLFAQLVETCKEWNRIDEFEPDWCNDEFDKWCIVYKSYILEVDNWSNTSHPIYLKDKQTAQLFLDTFRTELEKVKELL